MPLLFPRLVKLSQVQLWFVEKDRNHLFICMCVYVKLKISQLPVGFLFGVATSGSLTFREVFKVHIPIEDDVRVYCQVLKLQSSGMQVGGEGRGRDLFGSSPPFSPRASPVEGLPMAVQGGTCGSESTGLCPGARAQKCKSQPGHEQLMQSVCTTWRDCWCRTVLHGKGLCFALLCPMKIYFSLKS